MAFCKQVDPGTHYPNTSTLIICCRNIQWGRSHECKGLHGWFELSKGANIRQFRPRYLQLLQFKGDQFQTVRRCCCCCCVVVVAVLMAHLSTAWRPAALPRPDQMLSCSCCSAREEQVYMRKDGERIREAGRRLWNKHSAHQTGQIK